MKTQKIVDSFMEAYDSFCSPYCCVYEFDASNGMCKCSRELLETWAKQYIKQIRETAPWLALLAELWACTQLRTDVYFDEFAKQFFIELYQHSDISDKQLSKYLRKYVKKGTSI